MESAYILMNSATGAEDVILKELTKLKNITEARTVYGAYDLIAKIEAENTSELKEIIGIIRKLNKLRSTLTLIIIA